MSDPNSKKAKLPGFIALVILTLASALWTFWGTAEMYFEGWGNPFPAPLMYLIPAAVFLILTILVLTWSRLGGWLIVILSSVFTIWWWRLAIGRGALSFRWILSTFPLSGILILVGVLFILEGRRLGRHRLEGWEVQPRWWQRNLRYLIGIGTPLLVLIGVTIYYLPILMGRVDDGDRGARFIEGNGVNLIWAPAGPGWNWKQPWGGYPSWDSLARYGIHPVGIDKDERLPEGLHMSPEDMASTGICAYLDEDGVVLLDTPHDIWRMPKVDEIVGSLMLHNKNAGCVWIGEIGLLACERQPDKETPLWAPDQAPIYYWAVDEFDDDSAYFVGYNGSVNTQNKGWGNPRHGYRCVREP